MYFGRSLCNIISIIIDDRAVGSIRLFPMVDLEISGDSQHLEEERKKKTQFLPFFFFGGSERARKQGTDLI